MSKTYKGYFRAYGELLRGFGGFATHERARLTQDLNYSRDEFVPKSAWRSLVTRKRFRPPPTRVQRILAFPFKMIEARIWPVRFARRIGVKINGEVTIYGSSYDMFSSEPYLVSLDDNVFVSVGAKFVPHDGGVLPFRRLEPDLDLAGPIHVGANTFIGMGALILKGVTIGPNSIVGANAVVTKSFPEGSVVGGNPAKLVKSTHDFLESARERSLKVGHLGETEKHHAYRRIFEVE